jgi:4'-phosphopantetheinyl transferase
LSRLKNNNRDMPSATLWLLNGSRVPEEDVVFFVQQLGASEVRRYGRFKQRERKRQFLLGRMLLRFAVSNLMSLPPDVLGVVEQTGNAPQLVLPHSQSLRASFSLSHSRDWVACVVGHNVTLGVDIEVNDPTRDVLGISELVFHPDEHRWLLPQIDSARLSAFYHLWCTREALYKLMFALGRETVSLPLVDGDGMLVSQGAGWYGYTLAHFDLTIAICSDHPLSALQRMELAGFSRADWLAQLAQQHYRIRASKRPINSAVSVFSF